jgi:hypothetical protein
LKKVTKNTIYYHKSQAELTGVNTSVMTQHGLMQGIKQFGQRGVDALMTELKQLSVRNVLIMPEDLQSLSKEDKRMALNYLMFLEEKRKGAIKGRGYADGRRKEHSLVKNTLPCQESQ